MKNPQIIRMTRLRGTMKKPRSLLMVKIHGAMGNTKSCEWQKLEGYEKALKDYIFLELE